MDWEELLRNNLQLIRSVKDRAGWYYILALNLLLSGNRFHHQENTSILPPQACKTQLGVEKGSAHTYSPSYTDEFSLYPQYIATITFNSSQYRRFYRM